MLENEDIEEYEIVGNWEFWIEGLDLNPLKLKVLKCKDGKYTGMTNIEVKAKGASDFYNSDHPKDSIDEAKLDAIKGFLIFWKSGESETRKDERW